MTSYGQVNVLITLCSPFSFQTSVNQLWEFYEKKNATVIVKLKYHIFTKWQYETVYTMQRYLTRDYISMGFRFVAIIFSHKCEIGSNRLMMESTK